MTNIDGVNMEAALQRTANCVFVTTHFYMGIGKMKQARNLEVVTSADKSRLRHQKMLIDSPELEEIRSQDGKLKRYLESKTCRRSESVGFLPKSFLPEVDRVLVAYETIRRPVLVAAFMVEYRKLEAIDFEPLSRSYENGGLGEQFNRADYPSSNDVERGFGFDYYYRPVGETSLSGISNVIIAREVEKEKSVRMQAILEWRDAMRVAGMGAVNMLFEALKPQADGKRKRLYDTTVEKLHEYLTTFNDRDLAGDTAWSKEFVSKLKGIMSGIDKKMLDESEDLKDHVAKKLEELQKNVGSLVQVSGRKFR